jgi:hypothetical protein
MLYDDTDPETWDVHHWQEINPIVCEGLVQLMCGCPQTIYHGGLLNCRLRYFDPDRKRPGVPPDVAVLVSHLDADSMEVELVNLHPTQARRVLLQAGAFAEHNITAAQVLPTNAEVKQESSKIDERRSTIEVILHPASGGRLRLEIQRYANPPTYRQPW